MTHEAGHAFATYQARNIEPMSNRKPSKESCEVHSMSMELFAWPWCEGFLEKTLKMPWIEDDETPFYKEGRR